MDRESYQKSKEYVSDLKKFLEPGFFPVWLEYFKGLIGEVLKVVKLIDGILQGLRVAGDLTKVERSQIEIAAHNHELIHEAKKAFEAGRRFLESISTDGLLWVQDETHESAIKAENEFRIAESTRARKARSIPVVTGEDPSERRPFFPRLRERAPLSGGDLAHKSGDRIFEPHRPPPRTSSQK